ncbi:hypothetical protein D9757_000172 [Collybiopsis confluens]|uniref:Uncharacterized protein n=1 Tax=Collybiopsis confluens TaxID=2823264 RepID=A0A8H5I2B9_9AGAR|nr:hypothetical protein D9757_000172 [Collybiopsis confluens]
MHPVPAHDVPIFCMRFLTCGDTGDLLGDRRLMPAPEIVVTSHYPRPIIGHVNLMVDTFIANANVDDLRSALRGLLASGTSGIASAFSAAARKYLHESGALIPPKPDTLFVTDPWTGEITPTPVLTETLARARTVYGVGMGFFSLEILTAVVEAMINTKWAEGSVTEALITEIDGDLVQAIQSCKEELETDRVIERGAARQIVSKLHRAIHDSSRERLILPFEKAEYSLQYWKF